MKDYIKLMRPQHYIKNILVAVSVFFSGNLFVKNTLITLLIAFIVFSLTSSCIYIFNDLCDVESDRNHPIKKNRPIASGRVPKQGAIILLVILFVITLILQYILVQGFVKGANFLLLAYVIINIAYSLGLKNKPIIDILLLSSGFIIRILYGAAVMNTGVSKWLFLTVLTFSLYMAFGKRWGEINKIKDGKTTRKVLKFYTPDFLKSNMSMCLILTIVFYSLWASGFSNSQFINNDWMILTVPLVLVICILYQYLIEKDSYADPVEVVYSSKPLMALAFVYVTSLFCIAYLFN